MHSSRSVSTLLLLHAFGAFIGPYTLRGVQVEAALRQDVARAFDLEPVVDLLHEAQARPIRVEGHCDHPGGYLLFDYALKWG